MTCRCCGLADVDVEVTIDAGLSYTGSLRRKVVGIDACIAPIVAALDQAGIRMLASCCGHGDTVGRIDLADGRVLTITQGVPTEGVVTFRIVI